MNKKKLSPIEVEPYPTRTEPSHIKKIENLEYIYVSSIGTEDDEQTLVVTFYSIKTNNAIFRTFFSHEDYLTEYLNPERKWSKSTLKTLVSYRPQTTTVACADTNSENQICTFFSVPDDSYRAMFCFQEGIRKKQINARHKREIDKIDKRMKIVGDLPKNFTDWLNEVAMNFSRYIYYKRVSNRLISGYCTSCTTDVQFNITKETPFLNVRHNQPGKCPLCNKKVTFKAIGRTTRQIDHCNAALMQKTDTGFMIRYFSVSKGYFSHYREPELTCYELVRDFYDDKAIKSYEYANYKKTGNLRWCIARGIFRIDTACLYTRNISSVLTNTDLKYSCIYELAKNTDKFNIHKYICAYRGYPAYEYLVKLRLYRIVAENTSSPSGSNYANLNFKGKGYKEVIGIDRVQLEQMQRLDGSIKHLSLIRKVGNMGITLKDDHLERFVEWQIDTSRLAELLKYVTPHKIINYINQNIKEWRKHWDSKNAFRSIQEDIIGFWDDYLQNCLILGYDMKSSFILFPRDLKSRHDEVMTLVESNKIELFNNAIQTQYEQLYSRFHYVWKGILIRPPLSADEIIAEGHKLRHCVGTGKYIENVAKGTSCILLVRNANQPDVPFYTMEYRGNSVSQCRGYKNCGMTNEVKKFVAAWQKKTGSAPEKELFF